MLDFRTGQILRLLLRTLPFIGLRLVVYVGIMFAYVIAVGAGGGIGLLLGKIGGSGAGGAALGGLIGFCVISGLLYWAREYLLYLVKAGHVAVLVQLLDGKAIPSSTGQIDYARNIVKQHFATSSTLFGLNQLVRGVLRTFNSVTLSFASWLPIPGLDTVVKLIDRIINTALSHLDQVILAQILRKPADNPWATARDSVVLYAQNYKGVLKNAAFLTFILWGLTLLILVLVAAPIATLVGLFHVQPGWWTFALAIVATLSLKAALIDPFATVALIQMYDKLTAGQTPDPQWSARLESISDKFGALARKAREVGTSGSTTASASPLTKG